MSTLLENPVPIWACGAVLTTFTAIVFFARRNLPSLIALVAIVAATLLLALTERLVVTEGEQVEAALDEVISAIKANDLAGVLKGIDPTAAGIRADAEALMPLVTIDDAGGSLNEIELDDATAATECRIRVDGIHKQSDARLFYFDRVLINWTKVDRRWLVSDYTVMYRDQVIDPVRSINSNRPAAR
jgi:hypothetical protein